MFSLRLTFACEFQTGQWEVEDLFQFWWLWRRRGSSASLCDLIWQNSALSELTDKPCGRVTSGIREPQLTSGLQKDTEQRKTSNVKYVGTCKGKGCGLHGITIPAATTWGPERSLQKADPPMRQHCYGYFHWQLSPIALQRNVGQNK